MQRTRIVTHRHSFYKETSWFGANIEFVALESSLYIFTLLHSDRKAKIVFNFGLAECSRVNKYFVFIGVFSDLRSGSFDHFHPLPNKALLAVTSCLESYLMKLMK